MDPELARLIAADTPKLNPRIANGYSTELLAMTTKYEPLQPSTRDGSLEYVDKLFRTANQSYPKGLVYQSCQRCTPEEQFNFITRPNHKTKRREFDVARADVVLVKFFFTLYDKPLPPWFMWLPFVGDAAIMHLSGSRYTITPVVADAVISSTYDRVFVKLLKAKINFKRDAHSVMINDRAELTRFVYGRIYNSPKGKKKGKFAPKGVTSLAHYLFAKYGFMQAMLRFGGCTPVVGNSTDVNSWIYPPEVWTIYASKQTPPQGVRRKGYMGSKVRIAVRKSEQSTFVDQLITAFFYAVDHHPDRMLEDPSYYDNPRQWQLLLGLMLFSKERNEAVIFDTIRRHFEWLDEYLDSFTLEKLTRIGLGRLTDAFELFAYVAENFGNLTTLRKKEPESLHDKELEVYYYVFKDILFGLHEMCYALRRREDRALRPDGVMRAFSRYLRTGAIFKLRSAHSEVQSFNYSGDNKAINITTRTVLQERYFIPRPDNDKVERLPSAPLHESQAEVSEYAKLSRSNVDGRGHLNPMLQLDQLGRVTRNPELVPIVDKAGYMIHFKLR